MKRSLLIFGLLLAGCGNQLESTNGSTKLPPQTQTFSFNQFQWQIQTPATWEILPRDKNTLFMARNGDANIAILPRTQTTSSPEKQILSSAKNQFFTFESLSESPTQWSFVGQPSPTNPPRIFWQKIMAVPNTSQFLLGSCSQHKTENPGTTCEAILKSWKLTE